MLCSSLISGLIPPRLIDINSHFKFYPIKSIKSREEEFYSTLTGKIQIESWSYLFTVDKRCVIGISQDYFPEFEVRQLNFKQCSQHTVKQLLSFYVYRTPYICRLRNNGTTPKHQIIIFAMDSTALYLALSRWLG